MCPHLQGGSTDPFAPECKIPLPVPYSPYDYWLEPTFIRRRNERERQRVRTDGVTLEEGIASPYVASC
ncbi:hypothetical protein HPB52_020612 [Rhipicephalus sanguineus]|uniref:Uncharacterized protein n=1 Tax=Rhipicephalus sanguineus TaxID=34632 RepID=A0A9D4SQ73_RHISA|nr:hypothetical protein HPB52_020612 [Rhipicephalus sanguineus]